MTQGVGTSPFPEAPVQLQPEAMLTAAQVAELLHVSVDKLLPMIARGEGPPALRVGRTFRFRPSSIAKWQAELEHDHATRVMAGSGQ